MNRFDRITAILIQLQSRRVVKAQDLATRFGTSLRTIYRDIRTLEEAGVPLYGETGVGYSLVEGYRLPPVMFTKEEAMAFATAEKLMGQFTDDALKHTFTSAMYKVKAVLRSDEKDVLEGLEETIMVVNTPQKDKTGTNAIDVLLKSIADKKAVKLRYRAFGNSEASDRLIEPIGIFHENGYWYTIGYCHLRETYRQFRADRIESICLTDILQQERSSLKDYRAAAEKARDSCNLEKIIIKVSLPEAAYLQDRKHYFGFASERQVDGAVEMTFYTDLSNEGFCRWYIMFADYAEIIEPPALAAQVERHISKISEKYILSKIS